ncbi:MAG: DUF4124 domain-containing protein [Gammaproteobacteria bacterium]|jgi:hypothetical protein|nr:DUF4124 domain-containing protein [Gammaproteobacteria bacterium]
MKYGLLFALACLLGPSFAGAQTVYRCTLSDGSIVFSDLPCRSDIGEVDRVDATPHQGHREPDDPGAPAYRAPQQAGDGDGGGQRGRHDAGRPGEDRAGEALPRRQRMTLERERKSLLSALKRRHVPESDRRAMIGDLRELDARLGLGPGDVPDMPLHDRDVYEAHNVYPGAFEVIDVPHGEAAGRP